MAYQKQNFIPGQKLKAAQLNHMEDGIVNAVSVTEQTLSEAQKSQARKNLDLDDIAGAHIGPEAPTNGEKLWIDTDEEAEETAEIDVIAKPGQVIAVEEVGEDSKPTKYKAVDLPQSETPNFAANEGQKGYIEGRTHYVDAKGIVHKLDNKFIDAEWMATSREYIDPNVFIAEQKLTSGMWQKRQQDIQPGLVYDVHINDVVYPCEAFTEDGGVCIGNNTSLNKNNIPFCIYWAGGSATAGFFYKKSTLAYPIYMKVTGHSWTEYNKLPEEFLPDGVVKSVNGNKPDEKGNVEVKGGVDVTAAVGQTIRVKAVDESGKPTEWEAVDLQERTHGIEIAKLLPNTAATFFEEDGTFVVPDIAFQFETGFAYTIEWNGTPYVCVAKDSEDIVCVGNVDAVQGTGDTGEPFCGICLDGVLVMIPLDGSTEVTIGVSGEVYKTIDKRYLPEDTVYGEPVYSYPVFDLKKWLDDAGVQNIFSKTTDGTVDVWENTALTSAHWEKMKEIFSKHLLCVESDMKLVRGNVYNDSLVVSCHMFYLYAAYVNYCLFTLKFQWSDANNCVQRSCIRDDCWQVARSDYVAETGD